MISPTPLDFSGAGGAPGLLARRARQDPGAVAYRTKHLGLYEERTWSEYADLVARCALGLEEVGVRKGDRVAILGDPCVEWGVCDLAAQALGAISYGIYPTAPSSEVESLLLDGGASVCMVQSREFLDKILPLLGGLPALEAVVVIDSAALFASEHEKLTSFDQLVARGRERLCTAGEGGIAALERLAGALDAEAPAFIGYTSGTTGTPKGVPVSHRATLAAARAYLQRYPLLSRPGHRTVAHLPPCHPLGRHAAITLPLMTNIVPHFGESLEDLPETFFEVAPTVLFSVPRYWERFAAQVHMGIVGTSPLKRLVYEKAVSCGQAFVKKRWEQSATLFDRAVYGLFHWVALRPILNKIGFDQLQLVIIGGSPLAPETGTLWQVSGVNVVEIYTQAETAGAPVTGQRSPFPRPGDAGQAAAGQELKLGAGGEILVRMEDVFTGYWQDSRETEAALDDDGWLHTGDAGTWENGGLHILGRVCDLVVTPAGERLAPSRIEGVLRLSPFVSEVAVFGSADGGLIALVEFDFEAVSNWARSRNIAFTGYANLAAQPEVVDLIRGEFDEAATRSAGTARIAAFHILPEPLDPGEEGGPITPTRKVKRALLAGRFREPLAALGAGA